MIRPLPKHTPTVLLLLGSAMMLAAAGHLPQPLPAQQATPTAFEVGAAVYKAECAICHQANREGQNPEIPALIGISARYNDQELSDAITGGLPRMVAFPNLKPEQLSGLVLYLKTADAKK